MKLGLSPYREANIFDPAALKRIKDMGFAGIAPHIPGYDEFDQAKCAEVKAICNDVGLEPVEVAQYHTNFISPDDSVRRAHIELVQRSLPRAKWMGFPVLIVGSGSLNPAGPWFDHRDNHSWRSFEYLVQCLKELVKTAEDVGIDLALECDNYTALDTPERARNVIDAVGSPRLKVDLDPVNWITYATFWDNGPYLHHMFDLLGDVIMGGHAKDVRQEDGLIIHLNETYAGDGNLNYGVYLTRLAQLDPDTYLVIEHTAMDLVLRARDYILAEASKVGVSFVS